MDRMETRELAYFIAVAETCHFGRAAERLGIAQPALSRAISRLERRIGVRLLERTSRRVSLTAAGETLLREGRGALDRLDTAVARTRQAAAPGPRLTLAMKPGSDGGLLPAILDAYRDVPGAAQVDVRTCASGQQSALLHSGAADVAFIHEHQFEPGRLDSEVLLVEHQVAVLSTSHRLAGSPEVLLADLRDELLPTSRLVADPPQALQLIALGRAVAVLPASLQGQIRRDVVCVPVRDAPPTTLLVAWPAEQRSPLVASFVRTAVRVAAEAHVGAPAG